MSELPLAGLRVLDLSRLLPGGFCSLLLADFGADVVKVEDTGMGDYVRWSPPHYEGAEQTAGGALFLALNRGKRSIRIDLKTEQGKEVLLRLVADADVVLESFRPGVMDRLGVGYERLRERNPRLVYCSIRSFGRTGPWRDRPGYDPLAQAAGGIISVTGEPGEPGVRAGVSLVDQGTGLWAALGVVAALHERQQSGTGREVDVSLYETALGYMAYHLTGAGHAAESHGARADQPRLAAQKDAALAQEHAGGDVADQRRRRLVTRPAPGGEVEVDEAAADLGVVLARGAAGHQQIAEVD